MTNWYAVYTRPRYEKKVAENFAKKKMQSYCPLNKVTQTSMGRKVVYVPLFTSYVFVQLHEKQLSEVRKIDGVINLVWWLGKPVVIQDAEIDIIKRFLSTHINVQIEKTSVGAGDIVKMINGHLYEKESCALSVEAGKVKLLLSSLGYTIVADAIGENRVVLQNGVRLFNTPLLKIG